jgi:hypothetical protein
MIQTAVRGLLGRIAARKLEPAPLRCQLAPCAAAFRRLAGAGLFSFACLAAGAAVVDERRDCPPTVEPPAPEQMQAAFDARRDHGFLWRITKDEHSSYLYGTLHIGKLAWLFPGEAVAKALK